MTIRRTVTTAEADSGPRRDWAQAAVEQLLALPFADLIFKAQQDL